MVFHDGSVLFQQDHAKRKNPRCCLGQGSASTRLGGSVTLPCLSAESGVVIWVWYKQVPGQQLQPVVSSFYTDVKHGEGIEERRKAQFTVDKSDTSFNLTINKVEASDEGLYHCGIFWFSQFYFGDGVFLYINDSATVQVQQHYLLDPASEGHNVTLNCTVVSGGCAGEHSVYWFRHGTPGSHPGIIYAHGDRSAGCEKNPEAGSSTQSCVYHLPKRNLSTTDAGTYYCAAAACGQITIGNGTKLEISSKKFCVHNADMLVYTVAALGFITIITIMVVVVLLWRKCCHTGKETFLVS
uniref:Ig-like domain-containing protein n=1 Tax=Denticeps clupeoides TaxID=299321 RepID=A0AAY4D9Q1_9TELE